MSTKKIIGNAIAAALAMGISGATSADNANMGQMSANPSGMEKCYGIAKAGQNDCGTASHGCGGAAKKDGEKDAWIFMPTGLCNKIVGGRSKE